MSQPDRVVVVGAGVGGVRTVERLRECGFPGAITLVGEEPDAPYDRPPLSKQVLRGERELVALRPLEGFGDLGVDLRLGVAATSVDVAGHAVQLADGATVPYDALVVATGARPRTLPSGIGRAHVLRTAADCRRLRAAADDARTAVVVGGGFLGSEVAASLRVLGLDVTIVELAAAPLQPVLGEQVAAYVTALHEAAGVRLRCGVGVAEVGDERVVLSDASSLPADLVVVALGVTPSVELLDGAGVDVSDGIGCDDRGRTGVDGVYALGDAARWGARRVEHWTSAVEQAAVVARAIAGTDDGTRVGVPYFWTDQYRTKIQSLGRPSPHAEVRVLERTETKRVALYAEDGVLTAVVGFASPSAVMKMRPALEAPTSLGDAVEQARAL